jgi:hypothetical protein
MANKTPLNETGIQSRSISKALGKTEKAKEAPKEYITDPYAKKVLERMRANRAASMDSAKSEIAASGEEKSAYRAMKHIFGKQGLKKTRAEDVELDDELELVDVEDEQLDEGNKEYITDPYAKKVLERMRANHAASMDSVKSEIAASGEEKSAYRAMKHILGKQGLKRIRTEDVELDDELLDEVEDAELELVDVEDEDEQLDEGNKENKAKKNAYMLKKGAEVRVTQHIDSLEKARHPHGYHPAGTMELGRFRNISDTYRDSKAVDRVKKKKAIIDRRKKAGYVPSPHRVKGSLEQHQTVPAYMATRGKQFESVEDQTLEEGGNAENKAKKNAWGSSKAGTQFGRVVDNRELSKYKQDALSGVNLKRHFPNAKFTNTELKRASDHVKGNRTKNANFSKMNTTAKSLNKEDFDLISLISENSEAATTDFQNLISGALTQRFYAALDELRDITAESLFRQPKEEEVSGEIVAEALEEIGIELTDEQIDALHEVTAWRPDLAGARRSGVVVAPGERKPKPPKDPLRQKYNNILQKMTGDAPEPRTIGRRPGGVKKIGEDIGFEEFLSSIGIELAEGQIGELHLAMHELVETDSAMQEIAENALLVAEAVGYDVDTTEEYLTLVFETYMDDFTPLLESFDAYVECLDIEGDARDQLIEGLSNTRYTAAARHRALTQPTVVNGRRDRTVLNPKDPTDINRRDRAVSKAVMSARNAEENRDWHTASKHWEAAGKNAGGKSGSDYRIRAKETKTKGDTPVKARIRPTAKKGLIDRVRDWFKSKKVNEDFVDQMVEFLADTVTEDMDIDDVETLIVESMAMYLYEEGGSLDDLVEDVSLDEGSDVRKMRQERDDDEYSAKRKEKQDALAKKTARMGKLRREDIEDYITATLTNVILEDELMQLGLVEPEYLEELSNALLKSYQKKATARQKGLSKEIDAQGAKRDAYVGARDAAIKAKDRTDALYWHSRGSEENDKRNKMVGKWQNRERGILTAKTYQTANPTSKFQNAVDTVKSAFRRIGRKNLAGKAMDAVKKTGSVVGNAVAGVAAKASAAGNAAMKAGSRLASSRGTSKQTPTPSTSLNMNLRSPGMAKSKPSPAKQTVSKMTGAPTTASASTPTPPKTPAKKAPAAKAPAAKAPAAKAPAAKAPAAKAPAAKAPAAKKTTKKTEK